MVRLMFVWATSFCMAVLMGISGGVVSYTWLKPAERSISLSATWPAIRTTGIPVWRDSFSTPAGTFPIVVCRSARPSPVMIRSAPFILSLNPLASSSKLMPGRSAAFRKAASAPPSPPAAPAPGRVAMSCPVVCR